MSQAIGEVHSLRCKTTAIMNIKAPLPVISNHTGTSDDSVATTPTMWATGSLSMTEKVKGDSSNRKGAASAGTSGLGIHSMCRRQVDDFWGRPLSTALIWAKNSRKICVSIGFLNYVSECLPSIKWLTFYIQLPLSAFLLLINKNLIISILFKQSTICHENIQSTLQKGRVKFHTHIAHSFQSYHLQKEISVLLWHSDETDNSQHVTSHLHLRKVAHVRPKKGIKSVLFRLSKYIFSHVCTKYNSTFLTE